MNDIERDRNADAHEEVARLRASLADVNRTLAEARADAEVARAAMCEWINVHKGTEAALTSAGVTTAHGSHADRVRVLASDRDRLGEEVERLRRFVGSIAEDWDCDEDAHRHDTTCRACAAARVLKATS